VRPGDDAIELPTGVSIRQRSEVEPIADAEMLVVEAVASANGRDQCGWFVTRTDGPAPQWHASVSRRRPPTSQGAVGDLSDDVFLGPFESEAVALKFVANQLLAHLAFALNDRQWFQPDPDSADGGMSNHLLHNIREKRIFELMKETFACSEADDEQSADDEWDEIDD
jgi:hypothetical protein